MTPSLIEVCVEFLPPYFYARLYLNELSFLKTDVNIL